MCARTLPGPENNPILIIMFFFFFSGDDIHLQIQDPPPPAWNAQLLHWHMLGEQKLFWLTYRKILKPQLSLVRHWAIGMVNKDQMNTIQVKKTKIKTKQNKKPENKQTNKNKESLLSLINFDHNNIKVL